MVINNLLIVSIVCFFSSEVLTWIPRSLWACVFWAGVRGSDYRSTPSSRFLEPFWPRPQWVCSTTVSLPAVRTKRTSRKSRTNHLHVPAAGVGLSSSLCVWEKLPVGSLCVNVCRCHPDVWRGSADRDGPHRNGRYFLDLPSRLPQPVGRNCWSGQLHSLPFLN